MTLLALDLGTTTGFCVGNALPGTSGIVSFKPGRFEGGGMRFVRFRRWLDEIAAAYPLTEVVFEEVRRHAATDAAHVYGGLMGTLTAWCEERGVPYAGHPVGTIKRHWAGKGNANKDAMIAASHKRGLSPADDNEADAQALFDLAFHQSQSQPVSSKVTAADPLASSHAGEPADGEAIPPTAFPSAQGGRP